VLPAGWQPCASRAIRAFQYIPEHEVLQIAYVKGRHVYDFPCPNEMYEAFLAASSKGRYVQRVLRPYARARGWSRSPYPWPW